MASRMTTRGVLLVLLAGLWGGAAAAEPPITVVFRYDDYAGKTVEPLDTKTFDIFTRRKLQLTVSVIPNEAYVPLSAEKMDILRELVGAGVVDVAQHGYTHDILNLVHGSHAVYGSEFRGVVLIEQQHRIAEGKAFLEQGLGRPVRLFVPPYDGYDANTCKALEATGFETLSAGPIGVVPASSTLRFVPATCGLNGVRPGVEWARRCAAGQPVLIMPLFHLYEYKERNPKGMMSTTELEQLVDWLLAQKDVRILSIGQAGSAIADFGLERFRRNEAVAEMASRVPPQMLRWFPAGVYLTADGARASYSRWTRVLIGVYVGIALVVALSARVAAVPVFARFPRLGRIVTWGMMALLAAAAAWGGRHYFTSYRALGAVSVLGGACLGMWLAWWRISRRVPMNRDEKATPHT